MVSVLAERAELAARLSLDDQFTAKLRGAQGALGQFGKGVGQLGAGLTRLGVIAGAATVTALTGAVKAATDYEQAFSGVRKTLNATPAELEAISAQFREMARTMPVTAIEFARIGEAAGALGISTRDVAEFSRVVSILGVTTNLTADQAADALGVLGNILHLSGDEFSRVASALVQLGNNGASTEAQIVEITQRFAAAGKQAGLTNSQILGFSSAIASVGIEVEAAGSSLSRLFNNATLAIGTNSAKLKGYVAVAGKGFVDLYKKDATAAIELFLTKLAKLDKFQAAAALKKAGITNVRDINAILLLSQNMGLLNDQLDQSAKGYQENTAANREASIRFATFASQVTILKNNLKDLGITIGTGMLPALQRATTRLIAFLQGNQKELEAFGKKLGAALDEIDWDAVFEGAKTFVGYLKTAFDILNALPTQIKAAGLAFLGFNKLSGGLLGAGLTNIAGGLIGTITKGLFSNLPVIGGLAAMPVRVVNWPLGGLGGTGGAGGIAGAASGISGLGKLLLAGLTVELGAFILGVNDKITTEIRTLAGSVQKTASDWLTGSRTNGELQTGLAATQAGINQLNTDPVALFLNAAGAGDAKRALESMQGDIQRQLTSNYQQEQLLRENRNATGQIDSAIRNLPAPVVNVSPPRVSVNVNISARTVYQAQTQSDRYFSTSGGTSVVRAI